MSWRWPLWTQVSSKAHQKDFAPSAAADPEACVTTLRWRFAGGSSALAAPSPSSSPSPSPSSSSSSSSSAPAPWPPAAAAAACWAPAWSSRQSFSRSQELASSADPVTSSAWRRAFSGMWGKMAVRSSTFGFGAGAVVSAIVSGGLLIMTRRATVLAFDQSRTGPARRRGSEPTRRRRRRTTHAYARAADPDTTGREGSGGGGWGMGGGGGGAASRAASRRARRVVRRSDVRCRQRPRV